jgi:hypothetical protein
VVSGRTVAACGAALLVAAGAVAAALINELHSGWKWWVVAGAVVVAWAAAEGRRTYKDRAADSKATPVDLVFLCVVAAALLTGSIFLVFSLLPLGTGGNGAPAVIPSARPMDTLAPSPSAAMITATPHPNSEYPKEVPISSLDSRFRYSLGANSGKTVAVELAPGIYSERSNNSPDLGTLEDYSSYVGLCVDVNRYSKLHPGGSSCW